MANAAVTVDRSNYRNTSVSFCSAVCCFCCQSETCTPPRCSVTKTVLTTTYHPVRPWLSWREGSLTYRGLDSLTPLYLQLRFSHSAFLLPPGPETYCP